MRRTYLVYEGSRLVATPPWVFVAIGHLTPGSTHTYTMRARDAAGNVGPPSPPVTVTLPGPSADRRAPSTPTGLQLHWTDTYLQLTLAAWQASTDDVDDPARIVYEVYRDGGFWAHTVGRTTAITDEPQQVRRTWTVRAVDRAGNVSAASAPFGPGS